MPGVELSSPLGAFRLADISDFINYRDVDSLLLDYPRRVDSYRANGTIVQYDWVCFVAAVTGSPGTPLSVEQMDVSDATSDTLTAGVALEAASAGDSVQVCSFGVTLCNIGDTGTIAAGDAAIEHASTDGASAVTAVASIDGTTIVASILGIYLGAEVGTSNLAPVFVKHL